MTINVTDTYTVPVYAELDIIRPDGTKETVRAKYNGRELSQITPQEFNLFVVNTKKAGKGDVVAYRNITAKRKYNKIDIDEYITAVSAERAYDAHVNAVMRMSAGGEPCDIVDAIDADNTTQNKGDHE